MKQGKIKRNLLIVFILLLALCFVTGCGLLRSDEDKLKDLLEDKYGEEFGVESYYYAGDMWAMCYPVSDPTLLFEVRTNDKVTVIGHDYYLQTVVQRQVDEELQPLVEEVFPGSFVSSDLSASDYEGQTADKVSLESMMQYSNSSRYDEDPTWTYVTINIFVDTNQLEEENFKLEYEFLVKEIGGRVASDELPDTIIYLYCGDTFFVNECNSIIKNEQWYGNSNIYQKIKGCNWVRMYFIESENPMSGPAEYGGTEYTLEIYYEDRMEAINNG
ncbi:MAG: hypothetical protein IJZ42_09335 [Lachnospiraceae bacterium]|nr:hypothetical protein [Lachnospiraceae bacterium]